MTFLVLVKFLKIYDVNHFENCTCIHLYNYTHAHTQTRHTHIQTNTHTYTYMQVSYPEGSN
jgi:hypothetical protein